MVNPPRNPYIAGKALGNARGFFGREDVFRVVQSELGQPDRNAVVLFGQRRIGKTSILLNLRSRLPSPPFFPVYFDLMDRARKSLADVLYEIAATIAQELGMPQPVRAQFDDGGRSFQQVFLPQLYTALGVDRRLVLLLDEFDVLDVKQEEQLPDTAAARAFFPYLRSLMINEPRIGFVFVVGRKAEDLGIEFKAAFKASRYYRVSMLDEEAARALVLQAEQEHTLHFADGTVERILELTARHPYLTQLTCQINFERAYQQPPPPDQAPTVTVADVDASVPGILEAGENVFEWIWDGLPPAERVIFSAVAQGTEEGTVVTEDHLLAILQAQGIRILVRELELAPKTLIEWEMLQQAEGGYKFFVELMRRWVVERKPLAKVKDELDRVVPLADTLYQGANGFYRRGMFDEAVGQLQTALNVNPNHLKARLLLAEIYRGQGKFDEALREFEYAYRVDQDAGRIPLENLLLQRADAAEKLKQTDAALDEYARALKISPANRVAKERIAAIWTARGETALKADDLATARSAFQQAGDSKRAAEIETLQQKREYEQLAASAEDLVRQEQWNKALAGYQRLIELDPGDKRWQEGLTRTRQTQQAHELQKLSASAQELMRQENWADAIAAYDHLTELDPDDERWRAGLENATRTRRTRETERLSANAQALVHDEKWAEAITTYEQLIELDGTDKRWQEGLAHTKQEWEVSRRYAEGLGAAQQRKWVQAQRAFADVVYLRPDYRDAASRLNTVTKRVISEQEAAQWQASGSTRIPAVLFPVARGLDERVWLAWTLVCTIGFTLGGVIDFVVRANVGVLLSIAVVVGVVGVGQWLVLRRYLANVRWWVILTLAGFLLGVGISFGLFNFLFFGPPGEAFRSSPFGARAAPVVAIGLALGGATLGALQWLTLRRRVDGAGWWILASAGGAFLGLAISAAGFSLPLTLRKSGGDWYDWLVLVNAGLPLLGLFRGISGVIFGMSYGLITGFAMTRLLENRLALPSRRTTETGARPSLANLGGVNIPSTTTMLGELPLTSWLHLGGAAGTLGLIGAIFVESTVSDPTPADFVLWVLFFFPLFLIPISLGVFLRRYNRFASYLRAIAISFVLSLLGAGVIALLTGSSERLGAFVTSFGFFAAIAATLLGCAILMRAHPQFRLWLGISVVGTGIVGLLIRLLGGDLITTIVLGIAIGAVWAILAAIGILLRTYGKFGTWLKYVGVGFIASLVVSSLSFFSPYMGGSGFIVFALSFTIAAAIFSGLVLIPWQNAPEAPVPVIATAVPTSSPEAVSPATPTPAAVDNPVKRVFPSE